MWEDAGYLVVITLFFVALPLTVDVAALLRLRRARTDGAPAPMRTAIGYLAIALNLSAIMIVWGIFYLNFWFSYRHSSAVVGGLSSIHVAFVVALSSLIFGLMAPKGTRALLVFTSLNVIVPMTLMAAGAGVL